MMKDSAVDVATQRCLNPSSATKVTYLIRPPSYRSPQFLLLPLGGRPFTVVVNQL